jgi:hypothetical protein
MGEWPGCLPCQCVADGRHTSVANDRVVARMQMDREIQEHYPGPALTRDEYQVAAEATLEPCACGGRFRYAAPAPCPGCRSDAAHWEPDPSAPHVFYD